MSSTTSRLHVGRDVASRKGRPARPPRPDTATGQELCESLPLSRLRVRHRLLVMDAAERRHGAVALAELVELARAVPSLRPPRQRSLGMTISRQDVQTFSSGPGPGGVPLSGEQADRMAAVLNDTRSGNDTSSGQDLPARPSVGPDAARNTL